MKIACDFDSVICQREGIPTKGNTVDCRPVEGAKEAIEQFLKKGYEIYILTNREGKRKDEAKNWLKKWEFPALRITNIKEENTSVYLDDRAVRFINWQDFRKFYF